MYNRYCPQGGYQNLESEPQPNSTPAGSASSSLFGGRLSGLLQNLLGGTKNAGSAGIFDRLGLGQLDKGDILLVLVLIYLFRESEDDEWLVILALVLLMGLG
ncbi:MAG: hypothetical protein ACI3VN_08850 [Candidatus Onthomonas sp.]